MGPFTCATSCKIRPAVLDLTLLLLGLPFVLSGRNQTFCSRFAAVSERLSSSLAACLQAMQWAQWLRDISVPAAWLPLFVLIPTTLHHETHSALERRLGGDTESIEAFR